MSLTKSNISLAVQVVKYHNVITTLQFGLAVLCSWLHEYREEGWGAEVPRQVRVRGRRSVAVEDCGVVIGSWVAMSRYITGSISHRRQELVCVATWGLPSLQNSPMRR